MSTILLTGSTGLLGSVLLVRLLANHTVYTLYRKKPPRIKHENLTPIQGDVTDFSSLLKVGRVDEVYHLAGIISLSRTAKAHKECFKVNYDGTLNIVNYMLHFGIKKLKYASTAYLDGKNPYEMSKQEAENLLGTTKGIETTILRPSIIVGEYETGAIPKGIKPGGFYKFVKAIAKVHSKAERLRRGTESTLRLPPLEPVFRIKGNPEAKLNLIPVDIVADAIARIDSEGIHYLTNPNPPSLAELAEWVGEVIRLRIRVEPEPKRLSSIEALFARITRDFAPYLEGEEFPSDIQCPPVDRDFIRRTLHSLCY